VTADYKRVADALATGADPAMLCTTCPWDRFCVVPPTMTAAEVADAIKKAEADDAAKAEKARAEGKPDSMPIGALLTAVTVGGRDQQATVCPVFAARLRSSNGRNIVDGLKVQMKGWDDGEVTP
jgi:hypothetical protein